MATYRLMPPANAQQGVNPITVNGRVYSAAVGTTLDVPDFDGVGLIANGWVQVAKGGAGPTTGRPVNPPKGTQFHDTTLGAIVIWDGATWRAHATGAAV